MLIRKTKSTYVPVNITSEIELIKYNAKFNLTIS